MYFCGRVDGESSIWESALFLPAFKGQKAELYP